jgi:hypothetical protein
VPSGLLALVASGSAIGLLLTYLVQLSVASYIFAIVAAAYRRTDSNHAAPAARTPTMPHGPQPCRTDPNHAARTPAMPHGPQPCRTDPNHAARTPAMWSFAADALLLTDLR